MELDCCILTDVGCVRNNNEDAVAADENCRLVVLADGMGGYNAGEVASAMAVEGILANLSDMLGNGVSKLRDLQSAMQQAVDQANRRIFEKANIDPDCFGMGTTVVMALLWEQRMLIGHVGDSRAYLWRDGNLTQLTRDHSLIQEYIDSGFVTVQEAAHLGYRSLLTRALGVEDTVMLEISDWRLRTDDLFLLCSDGLTDMLNDADIARCLGENDLLQDQAQQLIYNAKTRGGLDNVSVALLKLGKVRKKSPISWRRSQI